MSHSIVSVEIAGQRYPVRSNLDATYVAELASYVDQKMRAAADAVPASDMLGLAILVSLNLADECFRARQQESSSHGEVHERTLRIERLVDDALGSIQASPRLSSTGP
jgi:cell division protein ZapA